MGLLDQARDELTPTNRESEEPEVVSARSQQSSEGATASLSGRDATVMVNGTEVKVQPPDTTQTDEDTGTWISGGDRYGKPRGIQALENRQIVQTSAMQSIVNGVADQVLGGELTFETADDVDASEERISQFQDLIESILQGPHIGDASLDDLIMASISEMMGVGQAYWQLLPSEDGTLPVASVIGLDSLTIRHNVAQNGFEQDPKYWQANNAFGGGTAAALGNIEPVPLSDSDLAVMNYPRGHRFNQTYPVSPAWQVRNFLEILANSTTHHSRFYSDNEIPPGIIQVVGASNATVKDMKEKIQDASGDPRDVPIVGGEGGAQWLDMGGTAVNLNVIEEQKWFFNLCLGALGLGKSELGFVEDTNRSNGEVEATRVYKRVAGPLIEKFEHAFRHICEQFDEYNDMGQPFQPTISYSDPREERAREERLMKRYQNDTLTLEEFYRRTSDGDLDGEEGRFVVEIGGESVDYGGHPRWVARALVEKAGGVSVEEPGDGDDDMGGE